MSACVLSIWLANADGYLGPSASWRNLPGCHDQRMVTNPGEGAFWSHGNVTNDIWKFSGHMITASNAVRTLTCMDLPTHLWPIGPNLACFGHPAKGCKNTCSCCMSCSQL